MPASPFSTTIEIPLTLRDRLLRLKEHRRQAYHEIIARAVNALERTPPASTSPGLDPLLRRHRQDLLDAARRSKIRKLWLFGSRARGDASTESDVDLLYELEDGASLWDVAGFLADAQDILGVQVDLTSRGGLRESMRETTLQEAVAL